MADVILPGPRRAAPWNDPYAGRAFRRKTEGAKMHVLLVSCVFPPDPVTSAQTSDHLAVGLADAGHRVTVVTGFPRRPAGNASESRSGLLRSAADDARGFRVIRWKGVGAPGRSFVGKFAENVSFGAVSSLSALTERADVVYANTWPIFAAGLLTSVCTARSIPVVLSIQDIHPEAACEACGMSPNGVFGRALRRLDRAVASKVSVVVAISEGLAELYARSRSIADERIRVVHNWMDDEEITPRRRIGPGRRLIGAPPDAFVAMFAGNIGRVANVPLLLEAAEYCRSDPAVAFIIAGDGCERVACEARARSLRLPNVRFFHPLRSEDLCDVQAAADVLLLPTRGSGAMTSLPSKLISYMLSARPVVAAVHPNSDVARFVAESGCGACVSPEAPKSLGEVILRLRAQPAELQRMGERARGYAVANFSRRKSVPKLVRILEQVARGAAAA